MTKKKENIKRKTKSSSSKLTTPNTTKLSLNLTRITLQFMSGRGYLPLSEAELMERLSLPPQHHAIFTEILQTLVKQKKIECVNNRYLFKEKDSDVVIGVLRVHPRGFGFLQPDDNSLYPVDIFIPKHLTQNAVDGDKVEVIINSEAISEKGPEGRVIAILSRGRTHIGGIVRMIDSNDNIFAYVPLLGLQQRVIVQPDPDHPLQEGDRIVLEVLEWGSKETETLCKVSHHIGHISDPSCDIPAAIEEFELRSDFPTQAVKEANAYGKRVLLKDIKAREDLREVECFTIDPDTAKDFDDALSLSKDRHGHYHLGVHIADVSHYVRPGTALDLEAKERCNSTYFPRYCLPMLPPALSENLCSLKPNVNRLTISVFMEFDSQGNLVNHRMARTVINSAKRFTYTEAKDVLDGKKKSVHTPTLNLMVDLCYLLKRKRYERGSIEFALPDLIVIVDENGVPQKMQSIAYDITHQLVEEFMLKANETVALHLSEKGKDLTYRIHNEPAEENLKDFAILATAFGFKISDKPKPHELQKLFDEALKTPHGQYLATSYIRRMRLAAYSAENIGHYGLGLTHYCHFTSPIRRYVDLVVHRILCGEETDRESLEAIAEKCSEQERISSKAEGSVVVLKKLRLLDTLNKKDPYHEYDAIVTRVKNFGFFFEVLDLMIEGFLHVSELDNDFFNYEESKIRLRGVHTGQTYGTGDRIKVMLKGINFITSESKWYLSLQRSKKTPKKKNERVERVLHRNRKRKKHSSRKGS